MEADDDQLMKLSKRFFAMAVISLFLMALLQGLHSFFFTLFFWPAMGFIVLAFYYQRAAKKQEQEKTAQWRDAGYSASSNQRNKRLTLVIIIAAISVLIIVSSLFSSKNSSGDSGTNKRVAESERSSETAENPDYARAVQEYNSQNYRRSIAIAKKALVDDPNNNNFMLVLGDNYGALKQNDSSFVWFTRAYQNGVRSASLSHWLGYLYDDRGSISQAIQFYKDALKQDSTRNQIYDRLAELEPEKSAWYRAKSSQWAQKK
jgi:tetratricopeptide (TPR) repeat protein